MKFSEYIKSMYFYVMKTNYTKPVCDLLAMYKNTLQTSSVKHSNTLPTFFHAEKKGGGFKYIFMFTPNLGEMIPL